MKKIELLAPAGSLEGLKAVINAGADAVYIGGSRFGARAYADNPDEDMLLDGIEFAHLRGKRVYLTVNTLLKEKELEQLYEYLLPYYKAGVDGVLVQDFGVLRFLHSHFPDLPLHASTQMAVTGPDWSELLKQYGVTRVVPARELSLPELKRLKDETGLEVEVFIHGALCVCYSGQCLYSSILGGRSGNRGRCAQPCRLLYLKDDKTGFDGRTSILEQKEARHFLSPKDLNGIDRIPELVEAGMDSLKIEGRMKRPEYAAGVVEIYRKYIDLTYSKKPYHVEKEDRKRLYDLYNRSGFTDGYFHRHNGPEMMAYVKHELTPAETQARHDLYEEVHEKYLQQDTKVPIDGQMKIFAGRKMELSLQKDDVSVTVRGAEAQTAQKRPLTRERIEENIRKTGGTDFVFRNLSVLTDGKSFAPVSSLNEIRRDALEMLKEEICRQYHRDSSQKPKPRGEGKPQKADEKAQRRPSLSVLVSDEEQFETAMNAKGVDTIYAESYLFHSRNWEEDLKLRIRQCEEHGKDLMLAMPYIDRNGSEEKAIKKAAPDLRKAGLKGFLIRSTETAAWAVSHQMADFVRADARLYTFNSEAERFLGDLGIEQDTAPIELNRKELSHRYNAGSEVIAYGRIPLMVTAQCLEKNTNRCTKVNAAHVLTDRMGVKFPVKCICDFCYNVIYNSVPLSLLGEIKAVTEMGFSGIRLQFTNESPDEVRKVIRMAYDNMTLGTSYDLEEDHTKGHYTRGVE